MKKTIAMMLTLSMLFGATALAVSRDDAQAAATALVGEGAVLKDSDRDDGYFEFEFRDDAANYDVLVDEQSGEVVRLEMEYHAVGKADAATLDEAAARAAVTEAVTFVEAPMTRVTVCVHAAPGASVSGPAKTAPVRGSVSISISPCSFTV